ncbi:MAG: MMPL family transporter [Alphaproteobacteria bacterium]|nr:MMPL family transporter [Alphaproteobacteria bacterium]
MSIIEKIVAFCCRHAHAVIIVGVLAAVAGGLYTANHFAMDTDSSTLISPNLPWRQQMARFDKLFPQRNNLILVVIDSPTADRANWAADTLAAKLSENKKLFPAVRRPDGGPFFERNGLLFLSEQEVRETTQKLVTAQPFLGALAADPSLRGVMDSLSTALMGIAHGQAKLSDIDAPMVAFADTLQKAIEGKTQFLSWRTLFTGSAGGERLRTFIEVQPKLDYDALMPGATAENAIRNTARELGLTPTNGVRVRLTGPVPLQDEEFATISQRADVMGIAMLLAVTLSLWLAVHSFRIIFCILATLFTGLSLTMAAGLLMVGVFNIISIAFVALFVGLGVDFAIQFSVRYRAERHGNNDLVIALKHAGRGVGVPLALAAAATAAGFYSFLPTDYVGVAELGLIAGVGMVIAFVLSITFLPALILLVKPAGEDEHVGFKFLAPADRFLETHRRAVLIVAALAGLAALATVPFLKFDFNPLDLRNRHVESMSTLFDLMKDPQTSPNTIDVLAPSLDATDKLADKLSKSPLIGQVLTLKSFVPDDQQKKLAMISDTAFLLDATLNPFTVKPPPTDGEVATSMTEAATALRKAAGTRKTKAAQDARRLSDVLGVVAQGPQSVRLTAANALVSGLNTLLDELRSALQAGPVSIKTMPPDLVAEWVAKDGTARLEVFPKTNVNDNKSLKRFSKAVLAVTPDATGTPITIQESGQTIIGAFIEAGFWSFLAITILLVIVLRREHDVIVTIVPLVLTALLTLATCRLIGLQLNFANIIALPLLLGIGVAFDIYFVVAWRAGARNLLQSSLTRAVIFSAMTTASGFGSLWLSSHPGTASMGELLIISLAWTLLTTLFFLPALLGPPPKQTVTAP